jgi:Cupin-like domain
MNLTTFFHDRRYSQITDKFPDSKMYPLYYKAKRFEFILRQGEMLYIPAGWFHHVFSEDPDPATGLCASLSFCDESVKENNENYPKFKWHSINSKEVLEDIRTIGKMMTFKSKHKFFPSDYRVHLFPNIKLLQLSFDDFLDSKNNELYITQVQNEIFDKWFPFEMKNKIISTCWVNRGNCHTMPHYDCNDNWLCQILGKKRVVLFPQSEKDNLYTYNPYPLTLIKHIENSIKKISISFHVDRSTLNSNVLSELLCALGQENEVHVHCKDCEESFIQELQILNKMIPKPIPLINANLFSISRYTKDQEIISEFQCCTIWSLTETKLKVVNEKIHLEPGDTFTCPGSFLYPITCLNECILIKAINV